MHCRNGFSTYHNSGSWIVEQGLIHLLRYIRDNSTLGLKHYEEMDDSPVTDLLRQTRIKNVNHLIAFSGYSWHDFQTLEEVQEHTLYFIKVGQLIMAHMFQDHFPNPVQRVSTMQHALQEWL